MSEARVFIASGPVPTPDIALLTDEEGRFTLHAPAPGSYRIACHAEGLTSAQMEVDVPAGVDRLEIEIEMTPGPA